MSHSRHLILAFFLVAGFASTGRAEMPGLAPDIAKNMRPSKLEMLSALRCERLDRRRRALETIRLERLYAKTTGGGVINYDFIYRLQTVVRVADHELAVMSLALKRDKIKPLACSGVVYEISDCWSMDPKARPCPIVEEVREEFAAVDRVLRGMRDDD